jgi:spermidine/putrescine transport system ATP-binding protein
VPSETLVAPAGRESGGSDKPAIVLDNVVKHYGAVEAVKGVSLEIGRGEFVALIGPSGCGKTSTLRLIAGLEKPTAGDIYIDGERVNDKKPWKRDTPLVWQNFVLFPFMTVTKNVEFGLKMRKVPKAQRTELVGNILRTVGIERLANRKVQQLSGGEMQRVGVARAIVNEPEVLLLDEPLASLDAHLRVRMQGELRELQRRLGITFLYVTHSQSEALSMSDRIVVMGGGRIQQIGTPREIYREPCNRFVAEFIGANTILAGEVTAAAGGEITVSTPTASCTVQTGREAIPAVGEQAAFVVYSDRIATHFEPGFDSSDRANRVAGRLAGREFVGAGLTYVLDLDDGTEFKFQKTDTESRPIDAELGDRIEASWAPEDTYLLPTATTEL